MGGGVLYLSDSSTEWKHIFSSGPLRGAGEGNLPQGLRGLTIEDF